jgi:hypothetical protein
MEEMPELMQGLRVAWKGTPKERLAALKRMEVYMCSAGEVVPGWYFDQDEEIGGIDDDVGVVKVEDGNWMNKDLRERLG